MAVRVRRRVHGGVHDSFLLLPKQVQTRERRRRARRGMRNGLSCTAIEFQSERDATRNGEITGGLRYVSPSYEPLSF